MYITLYTYAMPKTESPMDVQLWFREQLADRWPAGLGCLSVRRSPCTREHCPACLGGEKHSSHFLSGRIQGRRSPFMFLKNWCRRYADAWITDVPCRICCIRVSFAISRP